MFFCHCVTFLENRKAMWDFPEEVSHQTGNADHETVECSFFFFSFCVCVCVCVCVCFCLFFKICRLFLTMGAVRRSNLYFVMTSFEIWSLIDLFV